MDISPCPLSPPFFSEILTPLIAPIRATFSGGYTHEIPQDGWPSEIPLQYRLTPHLIKLMKPVLQKYQGMAALLIKVTLEYRSAGQIHFMEDNLLHAISKLGMCSSMLLLKFFANSK